MEGDKGKVVEPPPPRPTKPNESGSLISRSLRVSSSTPSTTTSSSSPSPFGPELFRQVQATFKRHRPLCTLQPKRSVAPLGEASKGNTDCILDKNKTQGEIPLSQRLKDCIIPQPNKTDSVTLEDASMPPSEYGSIVDTHEENFNTLRDQPKSLTGYRSNITAASSVTESEHILMAQGQKKVHFPADITSKSSEMDWEVGNQMEAVTAASHVLGDKNIQSTHADGNRNSSLLENRAFGVIDQIHQFRNFIQNDLSQPMTQASVAGSSCTTTTLMTSTSAPYYSQPHLMSNSNLVMESQGESKLKSEHTEQPSYPSSKHENRLAADQTAIAVPSSTVATDSEVKRPNLAQGEKSSIPINDDMPKDTSRLEDNSAKECVTDIQSEAPLSKVSSSRVKLEPSKSEKQEKGMGSKAASSSRRKGYDPDAFFKVNGKLYQRLGKIGSGGSSEVHKVITSDCSVYALKKIKLKGRDYATAYGFCQEIEYLKRLKGKKNIIQLIDYEVTDKILLDEVMNSSMSDKESGSMSNKEGKLKEDGCIYMVLEYGEIDLACMLSQKWGELDDSDSIIDENWLRFYFQQILLAVNTIHEERIVHSDLKPANFLLVRGSLKLIDFGIAKAIMNDTTNIQRDSQVGTLSYMSPEAFMCNETDANGNIIKCGRPSDIWSLGCILYQMVYGRTPFSDYKTFWLKFKVITDPNHEITYEPLPNPWLLDLMKKCLAWERTERWRIPQLLEHPFLVPPVPAELPAAPLEQSCSLFQLIAESCENDGKVSLLCAQLQNLVVHPSQLSVSQYQTLLCDVTTLCLQLQEQLGNS